MSEIEDKIEQIVHIIIKKKWIYMITTYKNSGTSSKDQT
jgi:hypothetical protein